VLFFLSGATGLAYEIIWFKRFSHVWGNSTLAMAAVVASFLLGLGIGAYLLGKLADRVRAPLLWYGLCEGIIGLLALVVPIGIHLLLQFSGYLYPYLQAHPLGASVVKLLLTFLVLGPPCICMGGTLPLVLRQFTPPGSALKESSGWLYAVNTLGAAAGCYLAGFHLLPWLGLYRLNNALVLLNLLIAVGAALLSRVPLRVSTPSPVVAPVTSATREAGLQPASSVGPRLGALYLATAVTGCASLILEVVWTRQLALILGGSTYAFAAMLSVFLAGTALGSFLFHVWLSRRRDLGRVAPLVIVALVLSTALGKWLIPLLTFSVGMLAPLRSSPPYNGMISLGASVALELLPTLGMGLLFPLFIHLTRKRPSDAGKAVGNIYALNILGSIVGAGATSVLLIATLGVSKTVGLALALYTAALVLLFPSPRRAREGAALFVCCLLAGGATFLSLKEEDPRVTNLGMYIYGYPGMADIFGREVIHFQDGASASVLVTEREELRTLRVNGKVDASNYGDMNTQLASAYLPLFLLPQARNVLVIGFGSGTTPGAALLFPETRVTCCEIEPAVFAASKHFSEVNHSPEESPRFSIVLDDGRSYLQGTAESFDLIISEPSNPWIAGMSNLFTKEFYDLVSKRLAPRGMLAQWIQAYSFSRSDYSLVVRTVMQVFPEVRLLRISSGDTILLASMSPMATTPETADEAQALVDSSPEIQEDLEKFFNTSDVRTLLLTHVLLNTDGMGRLAGEHPGGGTNTDINMRLEFDAPLSLFRETEPSEDVATLILSAVRSSWVSELSRELGLKSEHAPAFHKLASLFDRETQQDLVREIVEIGLRLDPDRPELLADRLITSPNIAPAAFKATAAALAKRSPDEASRLSHKLYQSGEHKRAATVLERLAAARPSSATTWTNMAVNYQALGERQLAEEAFRRAISLDPFNEVTRNAYELFQTKGE
jgi:spermidine synthase